MLLATALGLAAGITAALRQNSWIDYSVMSLAMVGIAIPSFVMAPLLTLVFGVYLGWLPAGGWGGGALPFLILPVVSLALPQVARVARLSRGAMIEQLHANYVRTARAKGLRERLVVLRHALPGALLPVVSYLGPMTAALLTGSVVIETIFSIPGIGRYFVQSALDRDYTVVMGVVIVYAAHDHPAQPRGRPALRPPRPQGEARLNGDRQAHAGPARPQVGEVEGRSLWQDARRRLFRNKAAVVSMVLLALILLGAVLRTLAQPAPVRRGLLGPDRHAAGLRQRALVRHRQQRPRPVRARALRRPRLARGGLRRDAGQPRHRRRLRRGAGFFGGKVDEVMMRFVDILYSLPFMFFVIILMVVFGRNIILLFIALGAVEWLTMARIVRGQTLSVKRKEFIEAAHAAGVSNWRIVLRHIIPNVLGPVVVYVTLTVPEVIMTESFLSFLGLGVQEPYTSWGVLISEGAGQMESAPWMLIFPAIFLARDPVLLQLHRRRPARRARPEGSVDERGLRLSLAKLWRSAMRTVNIHAAKTHLSSLLEEVQRGEEIVIAKAGKPVAKLVPFGGPRGAAQARPAARQDLGGSGRVGSRSRARAPVLRGRSRASRRCSTTISTSWRASSSRRERSDEAAPRFPCAATGLVAEPERLASRHVVAGDRRSSNDVFYSAVNLWELAIKRAKGTSRFRRPRDAARRSTEQHFRELPVTTRHGLEAAALPPHHADPFDRMLIAQARLEGLTLVTSRSACSGATACR